MRALAFVAALLSLAPTCAERTTPGGNDGSPGGPADAGRDASWSCVADGPIDVLPQFDGIKYDRNLAAGEMEYLCGDDYYADMHCAAPDVPCCVTGNNTTSFCAVEPVVGCDLTVFCDGPEDCQPGERCCGPTAGLARTFCSSCGCPGPVVCHTDGDCPTAGQTCCDTVTAGYAYRVCVTGPSCPR